jgi:hypothetical protein
MNGSVLSLEQAIGVIREVKKTFFKTPQYRKMVSAAGLKRIEKQL